MLDKILVPVDGSELGDRILHQVKRILVRKDAEVMIVRVVPPAAVAQEKKPGEAIDVARDHVEGIVNDLRAQGARASYEILVGEPADRLNQFALQWNPSLITMATHGRTGLARWIRGSTAERVLRSSRHPLLLANPAATGAREELRFKRILVALDGSENAGKILPRVAELAKLYGSEVILHTVIELPPVEYPAIAFTMSTKDAEALLRGYLTQEMLAKVGAAPKAFDGIPLRNLVSTGMPASSIVDAARDERADLIALTTHGRTGVSRWAFGSVAEQVVRHAPCPLLVMRTATSPGEHPTT